MSEIETLLNTLRQIEDCEIFAPAGDPVLQSGHTLPDDLAEFYRLCGGAVLFDDSPFPITISSPQKFVIANRVIYESVSKEDLESSRNDICWSWYLIGEGGSSQYLTIDLDPKRQGWCYDSHWVLHGGNSYVIAWTFTELLRRLINAKGETYFWNDIPFDQRKSPYDEL